jgi:RNA polymerase sigma-70 factor (ECF subfamily)
MHKFGKNVMQMQHSTVLLHLFKAWIMKNSLDLKLIESCRKGDRAAQKVMYDCLAPKMFPVCIRYVGNREAAEDVLQDGFITLFTHLESYKGEGSFEGWARKIFVTTALMELRKKDALKMSEELEAARGMKAETVSQIQSIGYKDLMKIITQLPPGFRTVFNMYAIEGYSHKEIGEELGISETTSRTQLSRARVWLQNKLKEIENV